MHRILLPVLVCSCMVMSACPFEPGPAEKKEAKQSEHTLKTEFKTPQKYYARKAEADDKARRDRDMEEERVENPAGPSTPDPWPEGLSLEAALEGIEGSGKLRALFDTSLGNIECTLFESEAPAVVAAFVGLARGIRPWWDVVSASWVKKSYYENTTFLQVVPKIMARGGCPEGNCMVGPGFSIARPQSPVFKHDQPGRLTMLFPDRGWTGQIGILAAPMRSLDKKGSVFGQCGPKMLIHEVASVPVDNLLRPQKDIRIYHVTVTRSGE